MSETVFLDTQMDSIMNGAKMRIALCQLKIIFENWDINTKRADSFITTAVKEGADIILFPEMCLTGFSMNIRRTAEQMSNSKTLRFFQEQACKKKIAIGFGWTVQNERDKNKAENHYTILQSDGSILSDYLKIHPFSMSGEDRLFVPGDRVVHYTISDMVCSNFICYDLRFPEIFQIASKKADCIFLASNWSDSRIKQYKALLSARAIENQCYIVGINCLGEQPTECYYGGGGVYDPYGACILDMKEVEFAVIDLNRELTKRYRNNFPVKRDRREDLYKNLY